MIITNSRLDRAFAVLVDAATDAGVDTTGWAVRHDAAGHTLVGPGTSVFLGGTNRSAFHALRSMVTAWSMVPSNTFFPADVSHDPVWAVAA